MPRIAFPTPETMDAEQWRVYDKVVSGRRGKIVGPLRAALHSPELADRWQALGEFLRYNTSLSPRLSELAILVTGRACNSPFEWYAHHAEALKAGIEQTIIDDSLAQRMPSGLSEGEMIIVQYASELNRSNSVSDSTYAAALAHFGARTVVELTALVGYYTMVVMTLNAHEIRLPDDVKAAFEWPHKAV